VWVAEKGIHLCSGGSILRLPPCIDQLASWKVAGSGLELFCAIAHCCDILWKLNLTGLVESCAACQLWGFTGVDQQYHWVVHHLIRSWVPPYSSAAQTPAGGSRGQNGWNLAGASRNVEILSDKKPKDIQRSGELRFYFTPMVPDEFRLIIWALNK
jgi:hypothetical protein